MKRSPMRAAMLLAASLAAVLAVQPVAAAEVLSTTGQVGTYELQDNFDTTRGADCVYENKQETHRGVKGYWLDKLRVRGPKIYAWDNGSGTKQWVGWKFKVQTQPAADDSVPWKTIFTSGPTKQRVTIADGFQFPRRTWKAPESFGDVNIRVLVFLVWYKRPGRAPSEGTIKARYEYYHAKGGSGDLIRQTNCYRLN